MKVEITVKVDGKKVAKHVEQVGGTLEQMEEKIHALSKMLAGQTLQASVDAVEPPPPFSADGAKPRHKGYQKRTLVGLNGPITIQRARYRCKTTGRTSCPLDQLLDLPPGEVTVSLARRAMRLGTYMSFAVLQEELKIQHDVRLSNSTLNNLMQAAGGRAEQDRQQAVDQLQSVPMGMYREQLVETDPLESVPRRLYVSCDGIMYRTRYRETHPDRPREKRAIYQEMKAGTVFWQDRDGQWCKRVMSGRDDPRRFGLSLWSLAVQCGLLNIEDVVFISDGSSWCETIAETYFKDATRILDWYHLSEHVWETARLLYPNAAESANRWAKSCLSDLHDSSGIGLLRRLERIRERRPASEQAILDGLIGYVRPRLAITDYVDYKAAGYVIGSGMMESTCKQLVGHRLKGPGMQWSESGALAMTALVGCRLNGTWNRFWSSRPLQRAA